jgi:hypothetical protein
MRFPRARRLLKRLLWAAGALAVLLMAGAAVFSVCSRPIRIWFQPTPEGKRHPPQAQGIANYARDEVDTFYTYPEWYIVWSYQAKADYQRTRLPSGYSYFGDIGQFWQAYSRMYAATRRGYPFATGDHVMLAVIGSSLTVEYTLKGGYEETVGRLSEWTSGHEMTAEDEFAAEVAEKYAAFVHVRPFYEFSFAHALRGLWGTVPFRRTHWVRAVERRAWLSLDYAVEAAYCEAIEAATHATYGFEDVNTAAWIEFPAERKSAVLGAAAAMKTVKDLGATEAIVEIPRYQEFTADARMLLEQGARFHQIAGNELMVVSVIAPRGWSCAAANVEMLLAQPLLTEEGKTRAVLLARVGELHEVVPWLEQQGVTVEHLYDY